MLSRVRPSLTANPSKPARFVALKRATIRGKKIWGRKRHALVDTQGHLLAVKVLAANGSDQQGARTLLTPLKEAFPRLKLVWGDSHYGGSFIDWRKQQCGLDHARSVKALTVPKRGLLVPRSAPRSSGISSFRPLPRRWVIERSFAWITRWRRLCRDHEGLPESSEAFIKLSASYRMLTKLAAAFP